MTKNLTTIFPKTGLCFSATSVGQCVTDQASLTYLKRHISTIFSHALAREKDRRQWGPEAAYVYLTVKTQLHNPSTCLH
jgi:hypothetical protein